MPVLPAKADWQSALQQTRPSFAKSALVDKSEGRLFEQRAQEYEYGKSPVNCA